MTASKPLLTLGLALMLAACGGSEPSGGESDGPAAKPGITPAVRTTLNYLSSPRYFDTELTEQLLGLPVELEIWDLDAHQVYFSAPDSLPYDRVRQTLAGDPASLEFADSAQARQELGDYVYKEPTRYFFRLPDTAIHVDENRKVQKTFTDVTYDVGIEELSDYLENRSIWGGKLDVKFGRFKEKSRVFANHGALVSKPDEASLQRFVSRLCEGLQSPEEKAQRLLDFVSKEIEYDEAEALSSSEVLKRANEVLLSGRSDCSGKAILYASLLTQIGVDFRLVYMEKHIGVALRGNFPGRAPFMVTIDGQEYHYAEPTAPGWIIGASEFSPESNPGVILYYQKTGKDEPVRQIDTGDALPFL